MMSLIEQWRLMDAQDTLQLYVMLDSLHVPNPISHWCEHEWVSQLRPLYYQTPLESMLKASPFLCQLAPSKLAEIERWIDEQLDTPWGWLYLSRQPWLQQITHWHNHLRILIDGQLRAVRLQDPRVLSLWLEEQEPALWQGLLDPVVALQLPGKPITYRPEQTRVVATQLPWILPTKLSDAWHHSPFGIKVAASNLEIDLWEQHPQLAESIYQASGEIAVPLSTWLKTQIAQGKSVRSVTLDDVIQWAYALVANQQGMSS
jgi:hypothetical protein